jgi:hypothetical protein
MQYRDGLVIFPHLFAVKLDGRANSIFSFCDGLARGGGDWKVRNIG